MWCVSPQQGADARTPRQGRSPFYGARWASPFRQRVGRDGLAVWPGEKRLEARASGDMGVFYDGARLLQTPVRPLSRGAGLTTAGALGLRGPGGCGRVIDFKLLINQSLREDFGPPHPASCLRFRERPALDPIWAASFGLSRGWEGGNWACLFIYLFI